jgi:hypothetical protein
MQMAESIPTPRPSVAFTEEEITRFFRAQWKDVKCEICHTDDWSYDLNDQFNVAAVSDGHSMSTLSKTVNLYLKVHCDSCGNTKFFLVPIIRRWLEANP